MKEEGGIQDRVGKNWIGKTGHIRVTLRSALTRAKDC